MIFSSISFRFLSGLLKRAVVLSSSSSFFIAGLFVMLKERIVRRLNVITLAFIAVTVSACGGGGSDLQSGSLDVSVLLLESVVIENGELEGVYRSDDLGPYTVVPNGGETSLNITATLDPSSEDGATISVFSGDIDFFPSFCRELDEEDATPVTDGQVFTQEIDEGSSIIVIRVANSDISQCLDYRFQVFREFETPTIEAIGLSSSIVEDFIGGDENFNPDVTEYTFSVPYQSCSLGFSARANSPNAQITIDGVKAANLQTRTVALDPGVERTVPITVTLPSGAATTYEFAVTREEADDDDLEADATIANISLSSGRLLSDFNCLDVTQDIQVNGEVDTIDVTVETSVDTATVTYFVGAEFDEESEFTDVGDDGVVSVPLEFGDNILSLIVTADSDEDLPAASVYQFTIERTESEWIYVSTVEELQSALQNAVPNQEIVITNGDYVGVASIATSGSDSAHFFAEQSGTIDEPITLRALESGTVTLFGDDLSLNSVLSLSGDYWQVYDLELENAQTGLILDAANNNIVHNVDVTDVGQRGIHLRNGSSDNVLSQLSVTDTGLALDESSDEVLAEALVIGSDDSDWLIAPTPGAFIETDLNNRVFDFEFGPGIASELIDIKEGTVGTEIAFGNFDSINVSSPESNALLVIKGNDVSVHHNIFEHTLNDSVDQVIATRDASEDFHTVDWGQNAEVFENLFDITEDEALVMVSSASPNTGVDRNIRSDDIETIYEGDGINTDFTSPIYQLQLVEDDTLCAAVGTITQFTSTELDETEDIVRAVLLECDASDTLQQWRIETATAGDVVIVSADLNEEGNTVRFTPESLVTVALADLISFFSTSDTLLDEGRIFRWEPAFIADDIQFVPRLNPSGVLTGTVPSELSSSDQFPDEGQDQDILAITALDSRFDGNENQRFKLIEVE